MPEVMKAFTWSQADELIMTLRYHMASENKPAVLGAKQYG